MPATSRNCIASVLARGRASIRCSVFGNVYPHTQYLPRALLPGQVLIKAHAGFVALGGGHQGLLLAGRVVASGAATSDLAQPALPQVQFLIDAVANAVPPREVALVPRRPVEDRVVWVLDLFTRLEQRDRLQRSRS